MIEILKRQPDICSKCLHHWGTETRILGNPEPIERRIMCFKQTLEEAFADAVPVKCPFILEQTLEESKKKTIQ